MTPIRTCTALLLAAFQLSAAQARAQEKQKAKKDADTAMVVLLREVVPGVAEQIKETSGKVDRPLKADKDFAAVFERIPVPLGGRIPIAYKFSSLGAPIEQAKLRFRHHKKGEDAAGDYQTLVLAEARDDQKKGPFDLERGCFTHSEFADSIMFFALPERKTGGGRFYLETKSLKLGIMEGDRLEFHIEVFAGGKLAARSEPRTKDFCSRDEYVKRLLAAYNDWHRLRALELMQEKVFPDTDKAK